MKIRRFNFWTWIFYPNIFNPFCWMVELIYFTYYIFTNWLPKEKKGEYNVYKINKHWYRNNFIEYIVLGFISMFINTFWRNRKLTLSYINYLKELWFPCYKKDDFQRWDNIRQKYYWYLNNRLIYFKNIKRQIYLFRFDKDSEKRWFINLPEYPGSKEDLQMTEGMDDLLNILSNNFNKVYLKISNKRFNKSFQLKYKEDSPFETSALYYIKKGNLKQAIN